MRENFEKQLDKLNNDLMKMGALCECAIAAATKSLFEDTNENYEKANLAEREIDRKEREIENFCVTLILRQQPVATDFRYISAALKMISNMERIGDQALDIAEIAKLVAGFELNGNIYIADMARSAAGMVTQSIESYVRRDENIAKQVIEMDDRVDDLFVKIRALLIENIAADNGNGDVYMDYLMVAKYLERIGDHAVNIAESVIYSVSGKRVGGN